MKVPGVGPFAITRLATEDGGSITNTYQLMGKFLALCGDEVRTVLFFLDPVEHCNKFWQWVVDKGIKNQRSSIVLAIAEKANLAYPG
ncbi:unnamed protein product, partial [Scytosiphon promiscuus]